MTAASPAAALEHMEQTASPALSPPTRITFRLIQRWKLVHHIAVYEGTALFETWQSVRNTGAAELTIRRLDLLALALAPDAYELVSFTGDWGREFESIVEPLEDVQLLETRRGRSSKDRHPWFALLRTDGAVLGFDRLVGQPDRALRPRYKRRGAAERRPARLGIRIPARARRHARQPAGGSCSG